MRFYKALLYSFLIFISLPSASQSTTGKLFIIGGGSRSDELMTKMITEANFLSKDYAVVLPMSSSDPDSAFIYFEKQFKRLCKNQLTMLNFDTNTTQNKTWNDSLAKAKLIFISGGDQNKFMQVVQNTPTYNAIHTAFKNGSTIAGTSAGAAVMCEKMITGNQKLEKEYTETFNSIRFDNLETSVGLGLIKNVVIDQHFLKRSRFNRLISALAEYPNYTGIGIDESTAIIVRQNEIEVVGSSSVIVIKNPKVITKSTKNNLVGIKNLQMSLFFEGQKFKIK